MGTEEPNYYKPGDWVKLTFSQDSIDEHGYGGEQGKIYEVATVEDDGYTYTLVGVYQQFHTQSFAAGEHTTWGGGWLEPIDPLVKYMLELEDDEEE